MELLEPLEVTGSARALELWYWSLKLLMFVPVPVEARGCDVLFAAGSMLYWSPATGAGRSMELFELLEVMGSALASGLLYWSLKVPMLVPVPVEARGCDVFFAAGSMLYWSPATGAGRSMEVFEPLTSEVMGSALA